MESNVWSEKEIEILKSNITLSIGQIMEKLSMAGFARTIKAIERKRSKLKSKEVLVHVDGWGDEPEEVAGIVEYKEPTKFDMNWDYFKNGWSPVNSGTSIYPHPKKKKKNQTTLVIPDAHVRPGQELSRFKALGRLIVARRPDNIVILGDFVTLESLSAWDLGKAGKMEGKRYSEDCLAGRKALSIIVASITDAKAIDPSYNPKFVVTLGNHEDRLARYVATRPELDAHLDIAKDLNLKGFGVTDVVPYRGMIEIEGVLFTHAVMNAANQAIGGKTALAAISQSVSKSIVIGHLHRLETLNITRHGADEITQIVSAGCFFDGVEEYADGGLNAYWRGVLMLTHYKYGRFDIDTISTDRLMELY